MEVYRKNPLKPMRMNTMLLPLRVMWKVHIGRRWYIISALTAAFTTYHRKSGRHLLKQALVYPRMDNIKSLILLLPWQNRGLKLSGRRSTCVFILTTALAVFCITCRIKRGGILYKGSSFPNLLMLFITLSALVFIFISTRREEALSTILFIFTG